MRVARASVCVLGLVSLTVVSLGGRARAEPLTIRGWQFHDDDERYLMSALERSREFGVNTIVLSHQIVAHAEQVLNEPDRAARIRRVTAKARSLGHKVFLWTHELADVPEQFVVGRRVKLDDPLLWRWLQAKYRALFSSLPGIDGIVVTFHETKVKVFRDRDVISHEAPPQRLARLICELAEVCRACRKRLIVRTFFYEPRELEWMKQALVDVPADVMVMTKQVPHDWQPFYPHNPILGEVGAHKQILETHLAAEIGGANRIPFCHPEYLKARLDYARRRGVVGVIGRVDCYRNHHALGSVNEINIYALGRYWQDPRTDPEQIWDDWCRTRYGPRAAPFVKAALRRSFEMTTKMYYVKGFWVSNHSRLPDYEYADGHISSRSIAKWDPDPKYKRIEEALRRPDRTVLAEIVAEKQQAVRLCQASIRDIERARPHLSAQAYAQLRRCYERADFCTRLWREAMTAFFGCKVYRRTGDEQVRRQVLEALQRMDALAEESEARFDQARAIPERAASIRTLADQIRNRLCGSSPKHIKRSR